MNPVRLLLVGCLAVLGLLSTAPAAFAHTALVSSSPAQGQTLHTAPEQVRLTFAEAVTLPPAPISVTAPDGTSWAIGAPTITGDVITAPVVPSGPAGRYTLAYRVTAGDGDQVSGTVDFTITSATALKVTEAVPPVTVAPSTSGNQATTRGSGALWISVLVIAVVIGVAVTLVTRARRRR